MQGFSSEPGVRGPLEHISARGKRKIVFWSFLIAMGGFLFGYDTGVVSGALLFISDEFDLNAGQQGSIVSILLIGAMVGALSAGKIADALGRRKALAVEGAVFLIGTLIAVAAPDYLTLLVARIILGLAVGAASATVPVYLSEISPPEIRGRLMSLNQLMITSGILVSYLVDLAFSGSENWRAMFAFGAIPAVIITIGALWIIPESYVWLLNQGYTEKARLLITDVADTELADRVIDRFQQSQRSAPDQRHRVGWRALFAPHVRPALIVGLTMAVIQQFGGINTIIYFAPTIIEKTGLSASNAIFYSVFIGAINLMMTLVSIGTIDRLGRRRLLMISLGGMALFVSLLGLSFIVEMNSVLTLLFMVGYIAAFAGGLGPVFWVLIGEIFPPETRAVGSSAATTVNWMSNFTVSQAFLPVAVLIGQGETFLVFGVICVLGLLFVTRFVPETKGRDYPQIDAALHSRFPTAPAATTGGS